MSIGFSGIGESAISGQETMDPSSAHGVIYAFGLGLKAVIQTWIQDAIQKVYRGI